MKQEFEIEVLIPGKEVFKGAVSEVVLPAYDGEVGVLGGHEDFVGVLGTGAMKIVRGGDDFWFLVSEGVYQVKKGGLTIFAELVEDDSLIDGSLSKSSVQELEAKLKEVAKLDATKLENIQKELILNQARIEVLRRTNDMQ